MRSSHLSRLLQTLSRPLGPTVGLGLRPSPERVNILHVLPDLSAEGENRSLMGIGLFQFSDYDINIHYFINNWGLILWDCLSAPCKDLHWQANQMPNHLSYVKKSIQWRDCVLTLVAVSALIDSEVLKYSTSTAVDAIISTYYKKKIQRKWIF